VSVLVLRLRINGTIPLCPLYAIMACTGTSLPLPFTLGSFWNDQPNSHVILEGLIEHSHHKMLRMTKPDN
jgi:hypothetical protein